MPAAVVKAKDIWAVLFEFQKDPPTLVKSGVNDHFGNKYVPLEQVVERVYPKLHALDVLVVQPVTHIEGKPALCTRLVHMPSETYLESVMPLMLERESPQAQGSAITYARRYALLSTLGLVGDPDDDAERAETSFRGPRTRVKQLGGQESSIMDRAEFNTQSVAPSL